MTLVTLLDRRGNFIAGRWIDSDSHDSVRNPATGEHIADVARARPEHVAESIREGQEAFGTWSKKSPYQRAAFLTRLAGLLASHEEELATIITLECGKPLREARAEVQYSASYFSWFAGEAVRAYGEVIPSHLPSKTLLSAREPIGVTAAITPWNFPLAMIARKFAAAVAAGCVMIVKPAPETPLSALALAAMVEEAEFPRAVLQVLHGDARVIGQALTESPVVRKLTFTGSTETGKLLMRQCADTVKRLTLELGGNAPCLVFDDADLGRAIEHSVAAKFRNAGQTCICINRFLVHERIAEDFISRFSEAASRLRVGNGLHAETDIGPLIHDGARRKVVRLIEDALSKGASLRSGEIPSVEERFTKPVILTGVREDMEIWSEEIFGPVAAFRIVRDEVEAVRLANDSVHGLAAYVFTKDMSRALRVSSALEFGMVGLNDTAISAAQAPFGGVKQSGFGREGGSEGIEEYQQVKYVSMGS